MKNLFDRLKFNGAHMDDKNALTVGQLQTLADARYSDISWNNNECASFGSDCLQYELFVNLRTDNARDEFHAVHYENEEILLSFILARVWCIVWPPLRAIKGGFYESFNCL